MSDSHPTDRVINAIRNGDPEPLALLFDGCRERLCRMVRMRIDPRLRGRVDESDVIQETFIEVQRRIEEYQQDKMPFFLWLRLIAKQKLVDHHRFHLAKKRSVEKEIRLNQKIIPNASSVAMSREFADNAESVEQRMDANQLQEQLRKAIESLETTDREVLSMRHFEQMTNAEVAKELNISPNAASNRYVRALTRLKPFVQSIIDR